MNKNSLATGIILFVLALTLFVFTIFNSDKNDKQDEETKSAIIDIQKQLTPYEAKDSLKKIVVIEDFKNTSKSGEATEVFEKQLTVSGTISDGYLYIKADVDGKSLALGYGDIYVKLIESSTGFHKEYGGHLIESQSLNTPQSGVVTELLYDLSSVKYKEDFIDSNTEVLSGNWLVVLNSLNNKKILGFSSTAQSGNIQEMVIYYSCLENTECLITVSP